MLLLGTEIIHIQKHGCMLHPKVVDRVTILEANIRRKDNDIAVLTKLLASHSSANQQRIEREQEVIKAAINWWMMNRPANESDHP